METKKEGEWFTPNKKGKSGVAGSPMTARRAKDLYKSLNIIGLQKTLLSAEATQLHSEGWSYHGVCIFDPTTGKGDVPENTETVKYTHIPTGNKYGDVVVYSKKL